jgi:hypothetical protein
MRVPLLLMTVVLASCGPGARSPAAAPDPLGAPPPTAATSACPAPSASCLDDETCALAVGLLDHDRVGDDLTIRVTLAPLRSQLPILDRFAAGGGRGSRAWTPAEFRDLLGEAGGVRALLGLPADACFRIEPVHGCALCSDRLVVHIATGDKGDLGVTVRDDTVELWVPPYDHFLASLQPWIYR